MNGSEQSQAEHAGNQPDGEQYDADIESEPSDERLQELATRLHTLNERMAAIAKDNDLTGKISFTDVANNAHSAALSCFGAIPKAKGEDEQLGLDEDQLAEFDDEEMDELKLDFSECKDKVELLEKYLGALDDDPEFFAAELTERGAMPELRQEADKHWQEGLIRSAIPYYVDGLAKEASRRKQEREAAAHKSAAERLAQ